LPGRSATDNDDGLRRRLPCRPRCARYRLDLFPNTDCYAAAACQLREAGVDTTTDETAGAERYVKLRAGWNAHIERLAPAMGYGLEEVDPAGFAAAAENTQAFRRRWPSACAM
jgi:hypothetical protein